MSFDDEVTEAMNAMTLPIIDRLAKNDMPECFEPTRATVVALASLMMKTLRQNEELVAALQSSNEVPPTKH